MENKHELNLLERIVTSHDPITVFKGIFLFFDVQSVIFGQNSLSMVTGTLNSQGDSNSPYLETHPVGTGGYCVSRATMEFTITNSTPWYSSYYIVKSTEKAYFHVQDTYAGTRFCKPPEVSICASVSGLPGGKVISINGPHYFVNGTCNGVPYETFDGDVVMENYAWVNGHQTSNMYTNIVVHYKVEGNGVIKIRYWVKYNGVTNSELAAYITITNQLKTFSASGGG